MRLKLAAVATLATASAASASSCRNSYATNYNASALVDDGSCTYPNSLAEADCGRQPYVTPIRLIVKAAQKNFKFSVDACRLF